MPTWEVCILVRAKENQSKIRSELISTGEMYNEEGGAEESGSFMVLT